jgi:hypothetical protein
MTRDPFSHAASRPSVETSENVGRRGTARGLCAKSATAALAAAFVVATAPLAVGCAEEVEREPEQTAQPVEPGSAIQMMRQKSPSEDPPLNGPAFRLQKKRDWWNHAREVLFSDIELSAEQAHAVDAIIEAQLNTRALLQPLDAKLGAARKTQDLELIKAAREEFRALKEDLKTTQEIYEELRAVLAEEQRPAFDMNRARHVAETQGSGQIRSEERAQRAGNEWGQRGIKR